MKGKKCTDIARIVKWKVKSLQILLGLLNERSKGRRLRLTLFARQAEECYLCIPTFSFPCFSAVLNTENNKSPSFPLFCHTPTSDLRCSQLSRLREEFVRLTFLTGRAFSPHFSTHTLALLLNLSLSLTFTFCVKSAFYDQLKLKHFHICM